MNIYRELGDMKLEISFDELTHLINTKGHIPLSSYEFIYPETKKNRDIMKMKSIEPCQPFSRPLKRREQYYKSIEPITFLSCEKSTEEQEKIRKEIEEYFSGPNNSGKVLMMNEDVIGPEFTYHGEDDAFSDSLLRLGSNYCYVKDLIPNESPNKLTEEDIQNNIKAMRGKDEHRNPK